MNIKKIEIIFVELSALGSILMVKLIMVLVVVSVTM